MKVKRTIEDIDMLIDEKFHGEVSLLSKEYINTSTPLLFQCKCGNEFTRTFNNLYNRESITCPECIKIKQSDNAKRRIPFEEVLKCIEESGCEYVSGEYKKLRSPLTLRCKCGNLFETTFASFRRNKIGLCKDCLYHEYIPNKIRADFQNIIKEIESVGCKYISGEYKNVNSKLVLECACGNQFTTTMNAIRTYNKHTCNECGKKIQANKTRTPFDKVKEEINNTGCTFISGEYQNIYSVLTIQCRCGNIFTKNLHDFRKSDQCQECGKIQGIVAKKKYIYDLDPELSIKTLVRRRLNNWVKKISNLYQNRCAITGSTDNLTVHHLNSLSSIIREQIIKYCENGKDFPNDKILNIKSQEELDNIIEQSMLAHTMDVGILISKDIHIKFHQLYGKTFNTPEQFDTFLLDFYHLRLSDIQRTSESITNLEIPNNQLLTA